MKMYRNGFLALAFALGAMIAAVLPASAVDYERAMDPNYNRTVKQKVAPFSFFGTVRAVERQAVRNTRRVVRQFHPRQIERNTKAVIQVPGVVFDKSYHWFKRNVGKNFTEFTCLQCGRGQRKFNIANGYRDCAGGDHVNGWYSPACTTPASPGQLGSLRINARHIERVVAVGNCGPGRVMVGDDNGPGGVGSLRCTTIAGANYRMPILASGNAKLDGPFPMQPDPCRGRGRNPRHTFSASID